MKVRKPVFCLLLIVEGFQKVFWNLCQPLQFLLFFVFGFVCFSSEVTLINRMKNRYQSGVAEGEGREPHHLPSWVQYYCVRKERTEVNRNCKTPYFLYLMIWLRILTIHPFLHSIKNQLSLWVITNTKLSSFLFNLVKNTAWSASRKKNPVYMPINVDNSSLEYSKFCF